MSPDDLGAREVELLEEQGKLFIPLAAQLTDPDSSPPVPFGLPELDAKLGGGLRRGFHLLVGYQHSGKTQLLLRLIWQNRDKPSVLFTMDEDVDRVSDKLIALVTGTDLAEVALSSVVSKRSVLMEHFPKLAICEEPLDEDEMLEYLKEVETFYQEPPLFVAYDYLEHFAKSRGGDFTTGVKKAAKQLKFMAKKTRVPWIVIHQLNRGGSDGVEVRAHMLAHGGEQESDTIIALWQEIQQNPPTKQALSQHTKQPTITLAIGKNKQTYKYFGFPWHGELHAIQKETGMIREMKATDRVHTNTNVVWQDQRGYARD